MIEELLDELAGSLLLISLDLRVGYHQIRMRPEDEHKTFFKTRHGHFEFKVMSYGVTGGGGGINILGRHEHCPGSTTLKGHASIHR